MNAEDVPADLVEKARGALIDHDSDRLECYDHKNRCCPVGEAHGFRSREEHQARAALAAVMPDIQARAWAEGRDDGLDDLGATQTAIDLGELINPYAARLTDTTEETTT